MGPRWGDAILAQGVLGVSVHPISRPRGAQADMDVDLSHTMPGKTFDDVLADGIYRGTTRVGGRNDHSRTALRALYVLKNSQVPNAEDGDLRVFDGI